MIKNVLLVCELDTAPLDSCGVEGISARNLVTWNGADYQTFLAIVELYKNNLEPRVRALEQRWNVSPGHSCRLLTFFRYEGENKTKEMCKRVSTFTITKPIAKHGGKNYKCGEGYMAILYCRLPIHSGKK